MTDTKNQGDKTLHVSSKTLSLKRPVEQGVVRQSFSHGRSKSVVVETVKRRPAVGPGSGAKDERPAPQQAAAPAAAPKPAAASPKPATPAQGGRPQRNNAPNTPRSGGMVLQTLSEQERDARMNALVDARRRDEEDRKRQVEGMPAAPSARPPRPRTVKLPRPASARKMSAAARTTSASAAPRTRPAAAWAKRPRASLPHRLRPVVDLALTGPVPMVPVLPAVSTARVRADLARTVRGRAAMAVNAVVVAPWAAVRRV